MTALDDVDVELIAREYTAIMGPSGSGKSTLMHCLAGLDSITAGEVFRWRHRIVVVVGQGTGPNCAGTLSVSCSRVST